MKHSLFASARAAPLHGLLATAALHALAATVHAEVATTLAPAATDLDTGQPVTIASGAKAQIGKKHAHRDSVGPPISYGTDKAKGGGYHRRREVALN